MEEYAVKIEDELITFSIENILHGHEYVLTDNYILSDDVDNTWNPSVWIKGQHNLPSIIYDRMKLPYNVHTCDNFESILLSYPHYHRGVIYKNAKWIHKKKHQEMLSNTVIYCKDMTYYNSKIYYNYKHIIPNLDISKYYNSLLRFSEYVDLIDIDNIDRISGRLYEPFIKYFPNASIKAILNMYTILHNDNDNEEIIYEGPAEVDIPFYFLLRTLGIKLDDVTLKIGSRYDTYDEALDAIQYL